jgi:hypothetical protein
MRRFHFADMTLLAAMSACTYAPPPIRVYGAPTDVERLEGQWSGNYQGELSHPRSGSIAFTLRAGTHEAAGDVLMIPQGASPYERYNGNDEVRQGEQGYVAPTHVLSIRFADVDGGLISGRLDNFWDPDHKTSAYSMFSGRLTDDVIEGTFTTIYMNGDANTRGHWKVRRSRRAVTKP